MKYRSTEEIEAIQYTGGSDNIKDIIKFCGDAEEWPAKINFDWKDLKNENYLLIRNDINFEPFRCDIGDFISKDKDNVLMVWPREVFEIAYHPEFKVPFITRNFIRGLME